jgi:glutamine synthetase
VALNTIVAEAFDQMCTQLEADLKAKKDFNKSLQAILQAVIKKHKRILFNGDNYTEEWHKEAEKRGLPNFKTTPEALKILESEETVKLFEKHSVFSRRELLSRYEIYMHNYKSVISYEAECARTIAATQILPAALQHQANLAATVRAVKEAGVGEAKTAKEALLEVSGLVDSLAAAIKAIDAALDAHSADKMKASMLDARAAADALEGIVPAELWPLPTYAQMLFLY